MHAAQCRPLKAQVCDVREVGLQKGHWGAFTDVIYLGVDASKSRTRNLMEMGSLATKLHTTRPEKITIPNSVITSDNLINYSQLGDDQAATSVFRRLETT